MHLDTGTFSINENCYVRNGVAIFIWRKPTEGKQNGMYHRKMVVTPILVQNLWADILVAFKC